MKIISYIVLGLFLAVSGLAATFWVKSTALEAKVTTMSKDLEITKQSLNTIQTTVDVSDRIIAPLNEALGRIDEKGAAVTERVVYMERTNEQVRDLLSVNLPAGGCLLDDTCGAGPVRPTEPSAADALPPALTQGKRYSP